MTTIITTIENTEEAIISAISDFIMKMCSLERYVEIKRQALSDKNDFEPYVAFQRLCRVGSQGITHDSLCRFLNENRFLAHSKRALAMIIHYDSDQDGVLCYKEFLEVVLPKEHPDLRAYVTQRECYEISVQDQMSFTTEKAMAVLFDLEMKILEDSLPQIEELQRLGLDCARIVEIIDGSPEGNLNFNNIQKFLNHAGFMPYDSEIIAFLRRIDRDDDGVICTPELGRFIDKFEIIQAPIYKTVHQIAVPEVVTELQAHHSHAYDYGKYRPIENTVVHNQVSYMKPEHIQTSVVLNSPINNVNTGQYSKYARNSHNRTFTTTPPKIPPQVVHVENNFDQFVGKQTMVHRKQEFNRVFESPLSSQGDFEEAEYGFESPSSPDIIHYPPREVLKPINTFNMQHQQIVQLDQNEENFNQSKVHHHITQNNPPILPSVKISETVSHPIQIRASNRNGLGSESISPQNMHHKVYQQQTDINLLSTTNTLMTTHKPIVDGPILNRKVSRVTAMLEKSTFDFRRSAVKHNIENGPNLIGHDVNNFSEGNYSYGINHNQGLNQSNLGYVNNQPVLAPVYRQAIHDPHFSEIQSANISSGINQQKDLDKQQNNLNWIERTPNKRQSAPTEILQHSNIDRALELSVSRLKGEKNSRRDEILNMVRNSNNKANDDYSSKIQRGELSQPKTFHNGLDNTRAYQQPHLDQNRMNNRISTSIQSSLVGNISNQVAQSQ